MVREVENFSQVEAVLQNQNLQIMLEAQIIVQLEHHPNGVVVVKNETVEMSYVVMVHLKLMLLNVRIIIIVMHILICV